MQREKNNWRGGPLLGVLVLAVALTAAGVANAGLVTFTDFFDAPGQGIMLDSNNPHYSFQHNFNDNGYSPLTDVINSATITLNFYDNDNDWWIPLIWPAYPEEALVKLDNAQQYQWEVDTGDKVISVTALSQLVDGILNVDLYRQSGDVRFDESTLEVKADRGDPAAVPEPASFILVGLGLLGVMWVIRRANET